MTNWYERDPYLVKLSSALGEEIELRLAPVIFRILAYSIDLLIVILLNSLLIYLFIDILFRSIFGFTDYFGYVAIAIYLLLSGTITVSYFLILEYVTKGRTVGKLMLHIRVVSHIGTTASFKSLLYRNILRPVEVGYLPIIGLVAVLLNRNNQRIGDVLSSTYVVFEPPVSRKKFKVVIRQDDQEWVPLYQQEVKSSLSKEQLDLLGHFVQVYPVLTSRQRMLWRKKILQILPAPPEKKDFMKALLTM